MCGCVVVVVVWRFSGLSSRQGEREKVKVWVCECEVVVVVWRFTDLSSRQGERSFVWV